LALNDILPTGDTLWLATNKGLVRVLGATPAEPPTISKGIINWAQSSSGTAISLNRLASFPLKNKTWIIAVGNGVLGVLASSASKSDIFYASTDAKQNYTALAIDAQKQIWAVGDSGIDLFTFALTDSGTPVLTLLRHVTQSDGLPDNRIYDLQLDSTSGRALIATSTALTLWTSPYRPVQSRLSSKNIKVWPNPVRLRQNTTLFVDGATSLAQFNLFAADGTLVLHKDRSQSTYGLFQIELPLSMSKLRPGVYYWSLKDDNGSVHGPLLIGE